MLSTEYVNFETASAVEGSGMGAPLDASRNPFASGASGSRIGRPVQTAFGELIRLIGLQTRVVVVLGNAGTGKTQLGGMIARACAEMGMSIRRIERGDLLHEALGDCSDVLLVDEADSMSSDTLRAFLTADEKTRAGTMIFMCLPSCVSRFSFSGTEAAVVELSPLSLSDARLYLTERGNSIGRPDLFTREALDVVIDVSKGVPRLLRSIASLAYFNAAAEGASQIAASHAEAAAHMRNEFSPTPNGPLPLSNDPGQISSPDLAAHHPEPGVVAAGTAAVDCVAEQTLQAISPNEFFGRTEAARERHSSRTAKSVFAMALLLLSAGASAFALMGGEPPRNAVTKAVSRSPAIAVAPPATAAAVQASNEAARQSSTEKTPAAIAAPKPITQASTTPSANRIPRPAATKTKAQRVDVCAAGQSSRGSRALPVTAECPGPQLAARGSGSPRPSATPRTLETRQISTVVAARPTVAAPRSLPAEPVRTTEPTPLPAQIPVEAPAPSPQQSELPAIGEGKVQTEDRTQIARAAQGAADGKEDIPPDEGHLPVIIFGYRLW